jgi:hypothetical protein
MSQPPADHDEPRQIHTHKDLDDKVTHARGVINALDRSLRSRRLYELDHPLRKSSTTELVTRFEQFFSRYAYLRLEVTESSLRLAAKALLQCDARDPEAPFRMYKDGIRELRFHRGISQEEIESFLSILDMETKQLAEMDLDLVSVIWAKDFQAIDLMTVDEFEMVEGEGTGAGDGEMSGGGRSPAADLVRLLDVVSSRGTMDASTERAGAGTERAGAGTERGGAGTERGGGGTERGGAGTEAVGAGGSGTPRGLPAGGSPAVSPGNIKEVIVPHRQDQTSYLSDEGSRRPSGAELDAIFQAPLDEALLKYRSEIERETMGEVIERTLDILIEFFTSSKVVAVEEIRPLLRGLVGYHTRKGDFSRLGQLLNRLEEKKFLDQIEGGASLWKELMSDIRAPEARKQLLTYLNTGSLEKVEGLKLYFNLMGSDLVPQACEIYGQIKSALSRAQVREYLIRLGRANPAMIKGLFTVSEALMPEAMEICRAVNPPGLASELEGVFETLSRAFKLEGLSMGAKTEGASRVGLFRKALRDPDQAVRAHTLKVIGDIRSADLQPFVRTWVEDKEFPERAVGEKVLAYSTLVRVAGSSGMSYLKDLAARKPSLFDGQKVAETRRCAVQAIASLGTPEVRLLLEGWAAGGDKQLKEFAAKALKPMG